jgi:hypothetical protein
MAFRDNVALPVIGCYAPRSNTRRCSMRIFLASIAIAVSPLSACGGHAPQSPVVYREVVLPSQGPAEEKPGPLAIWTQVQTGWHGAIAGRGDDDIWAIGGPANVPSVVRHWNAKEWEKVSAPSPTPIADVAVDAAGTVWVVGRDLIASRAANSSAWKSYTLPTLAPNAWCCESVSRAGHEGWMIGPDVVLHDTSSALIYDPSLPQNGLGRIFAIAPDDVFRTTKLGIWHWNGAMWTALPFPKTSTAVVVYALWGLPSSDVWMPIGDGTIQHWTGSAWQGHTVAGRKPRCTAIAGVTADDIWCTGEQAMVAHFDGKTWSRVSSPTSKSGERVSALSEIYATAHHVWASGDGIWRLDR